MLALSHLLNGVAMVLYGFLWIYKIILIARAITSWVSANPHNPIVAFLYMVTEPAIRLIRRRLPANLRYFPLDIAFLVLFALVLFAEYGIVPLMLDYAAQMRHSALSGPAVRRRAFARRFRGLDPDEVRGYLTLVAEELAAVERERSTLEQQVKHMEGLLEEHRQREGILKSTLLTAQKASDDIREAANRQAEASVKEAELQADKLLELAQGRAHEVESGILELRALRTALRTDIRALVTRLTSLLDLQEEAELEDNLRFLKRREESGRG